jgi:cytochrome P450
MPWRKAPAPPRALSCALLKSDEPIFSDGSVLIAFDAMKIEQFGFSSTLSSRLHDVRHALDVARASFAPGTRAPGPKGDAIFGHLRLMGRDPLGFLADAQRECGDVARFRFGYIEAYLFSHPDAVKYILQENHKDFDKQTPGFKLLRHAFGNGILTSEGSFWLRQRRIMQPAFHRQRLEGFANNMVRTASAVASKWEERAIRGDTFDVFEEMLTLALTIVSDTLFSTEVSDDAKRVAECVDLMQSMFNERLYRFVNLPAIVPTRSNRHYRTSLVTLRKVVLGIVQKRRARSTAPGGSSDLLAMLMEARDEETGEGMSDTQLLDEVLTLFLAGHETASTALAWTFYLLSRHPDARRRLEDELARELGDGPVTTAILPKLALTRRIVMESMRLFPPAYVTGRRAVSSQTISGYRIEQGSLCFVSPYVTHRHPQFWDNPEGFDPDRFLPDASQTRSPWAYFPFGGGPHICIGQGLAMMEVQIVLATLARRFRLDLVPGHRIEPLCAITLKPKNGIRVVAKRITTK